MNLQLVVLNRAHFEKLYHGICHVATRINDQEVRAEESEQDNLSVVFVVCTLWTVETLGFKNDQVLHIATWAHLLRDLLQRKVYSLRAPSCACQKLSTEAEIHQSRFSCALRPYHSSNHALFSFNITYYFLQHVLTHF